MNRLTAIGLASLVAYGLLITSKYVGVVSAARQDEAPKAAVATREAETLAFVPVKAEARPQALALPTPIPRAEPVKASATALDFRSTRDLKAFADALAARRESLTADERYHLAKALEECQFATNVNEDLAAYSAKQRRAFLATLTAGDPLNAKRIAAYEAVDNTQRCLRFQGSKISPRDIEDLFQLAAQQGDARAQARLLVADLNNKTNNSNATKGNGENSAQTRVQADEMQGLIALLESRDPEATMIVGQFLASNAVANQLRIGPNGETPEPSAFLGAFSLVACQLGPDCISMTRDPQTACAYGAYCTAASYEDLFQNFLASPWVYSNATRYSAIISTAINSRNWSLIGLQPPTNEKRRLGGPQ